MVVADEERLARVTSAAAHSYPTRGAGLPPRTEPFEIGTDLLRAAHMAGLSDTLLDLAVDSALYFGEDPVRAIHGHITMVADYGEPFMPAPPTSELAEFEQELLLALKRREIITAVDDDEEAF